MIRTYTTYILIGLVMILGIGFGIQVMDKTTPQSQEEVRLLSFPDSDKKYIDLANYYRSTKQYDKAERMSKKAIELNPKNDMPYLQLGNYYRYTKRFDEAIIVIGKAMEINPNNDWPYVQMGNIYKDQGKPDDAIPMFKKAIELNPKRNWGYKELGRVYLGQNKPDEAEKMFLRAIDIDPKPEEPDNAYIDLANLYTSLGQTDKATAILQKAPKK